MSPRVAVLVIAAALAVAGAAWLLWAPAATEAPVDEVAPALDAVVATADRPMTPMSLYFLGEDGMLHGVEIEVPAEDGEGRIRALVEALLAGPRGAKEGNLFLSSPLPASVQLASVYFLEPGSVALDLRMKSKAAAPAPTPSAAASGQKEVPVEAAAKTVASQMGAMGSKEEMLAVYSLVNTVAMGSEAVERVVLLLDGKQPETLAGHVDLTRPLRPDRTWISERSRADG